MAGKPKFAELIDSLRSKIDVREPDQCWVWTGAVASHGYGVGSFRHRPFLAHRAAYETMIGSIPAGISVLHRCDNKVCCNPRHLFLGTLQDNMDDMTSKQRHCFGERKLNAKITDAQARHIKRLPGSQTSIAETFDIDQSTVSRIKSGHRWRYACQ